MEKKKVIMRIERHDRDSVVLAYPNGRAHEFLAPLFEFCERSKGGYVQCEMSVPYRKRTLEENAKWWAMCTEYGHWCGMTKDDVALGVKYRAMDEGLWEAEDVPFSRSGARRPVSTAKSSTKEMAVLIDVLYRIAAEDGYVFSE